MWIELVLGGEALTEARGRRRQSCQTKRFIPLRGGQQQPCPGHEVDQIGAEELIKIVELEKSSTKIMLGCKGCCCAQCQWHLHGHKVIYIDIGVLLRILFGTPI